MNYTTYYLCLSIFTLHAMDTVKVHNVDLFQKKIQEIQQNKQNQTVCITSNALVIQPMPTMQEVESFKKWPNGECVTISQNKLYRVNDSFNPEMVSLPARYSSYLIKEIIHHIDNDFYLVLQAPKGNMKTIKRARLEKNKIVIKQDLYELPNLWSSAVVITPAESFSSFIATFSICPKIYKVDHAELLFVDQKPSIALRWEEGCKRLSKLKAFLNQEIEKRGLKDVAAELYYTNHPRVKNFIFDWIRWSCYKNKPAQSTQIKSSNECAPFTQSTTTPDEVVIQQVKKESTLKRIKNKILKK